MVIAMPLIPCPPPPPNPPPNGIPKMPPEKICDEYELMPGVVNVYDASLSANARVGTKSITSAKMIRTVNLICGKYDTSGGRCDTERG